MSWPRPWRWLPRERRGPSKAGARQPVSGFKGPNYQGPCQYIRPKSKISRAAIILGQGGAVVALHAVAEERRVEMVEQRPFEPPLPLGIPVRRHHVGEVARGEPDAPGVPVEVAQVVRAVLRHETVPDMGVAMHQRDVAVGQDTRLQAGRGGKEALVELTPIARQTIAQMVG